jgi:hypothetical protein
MKQYYLIACLMFIAVMALPCKADKSKVLDTLVTQSGKGGIDPALILYKESQSISTGLKESRAIAVDSNGIIYAAGDSAIRIFDADGKPLREIPLDCKPTCITVDGGKIFIGAKSQVEICNVATGQVTKWSAVSENGLFKKAIFTSIAVSKDDVFIADAGRKIVLHYNIDGTLINTINGKGAEGGRFAVPSPYFDLAVGLDGLLRVVNPGQHRIEAYTFAGDMEFAWGKYSVDIDGFCGCCNPVNFVILKDGSFVTAEKGLARVKIYDAQGKFKCVVAGPDELIGGRGKAGECQSPEQCQSGGFDIAVDHNDRILVLDTLTGTVKIFTKKKNNG